MDPLLSTEVGRRELLLGNEAIVRGALEAGVGLVTGYPGTPASEIGDTFARLHRSLGIHFEYSVNEKVALELAFGASLTGVRALTSMKHLGLTYGADPLSTMPYIGVVGGMVIVSAADPGCLTSPNEQDQRHLGRMLGLPTLDPATPDEARRMTAWAFELSEVCELPVLLRITTRVCHTRAQVSFGALGPQRGLGTFRKDPKRFLPTPAHARRLREELQRRLDVACRMISDSPFNTAPAGSGAKALVAAGAPRNVVRAALDRLGQSVPVLELGALHPLPHELILPFLKQHEDVLVVEELTPYLEDSLLAIAHHFGLPVRIHGKRDEQMPWPFELELDEVERRVRHFLGLEPAAGPQPTPAAAIALPARGPVLCAGCLHRNVFFAASSVFGDEATYVNDIGCYTLGANEPHRAGDVLLAMGSSVPLASGIARSTGQRVVAFLGDSTFFHSGIPGLVNAVEHRDEVVVVILDNRITAMTGFQPNPTSPGATQSGRIPAVVRALGVEDLAVVDAADVHATVRALERAKRGRGVSVVVAEGPCAQWVLRHGSLTAQPPPTIDPSRCHTCGMAEAGLHCELSPSLRAQKRMAVQKEVPPERSRGTVAEVPRTSPCSLECPVGICIPAYVGAIAAGEPERAYQAVALRAALPSICAHICHRPCEERCVLGGPGSRPIAVNALKQYLTDRHTPDPVPQRPPSGQPVAIVGAGPAGLAAAKELVKRGYAPTLFDARERPGGMLEYAIPDYRLPPEVLRQDVAAVLALGIPFKGGRRLGRDFTVEALGDQGFAAVLLALGAQRGARPGMAGAQLPGVDDALSFLERPPSCRGEAVLVLGGGDVAVDVARTALRRGAATVTLCFPEPEAQLTAAGDTVRLAVAEGARLVPEHAATSLEAGADGRVSRAVLAAVRGFRRTAAGVTFEAAGPAQPLEVSRVVFATGQRSDLAGITLPAGLVRDNGWLGADVYGRTSSPWLFAAGDIVNGPDTVTAAMAGGVRAAWAIDSFLSAGREIAACAAPLPRPRAAHPDGPTPLTPSGVEGRGREVPLGSPSSLDPSTPLTTGFARDEREAAFNRLASGASNEPASLTADEALAEAQRCLLCGMCKNCNSCVELLGCPAIARTDGEPKIVAALCVSCGACEATCPNQAIGNRP